MATEYIVNCI